MDKGAKARAWIGQTLGLGAWMRGRRDELVSQIGEQAAAQFKEDVDRVIRYAKLAAWFGIAGFVVGLAALVAVVILALM